MTSISSTTSAVSNPYHHLVSGSIQDRIWMLQLAQREHKLTKPPTSGIAIVLPEPMQGCYPDRDYTEDEASTKTPDLQPDYYSEKATATDRPEGPKKTSIICILPKWPGRFLRTRKRVLPATKATDSSTIRLLDESSSHGEWS
eukprot:scaffold222_cov175-Amphora_coffeaeformis.AAC.11